MMNFIKKQIKKVYKDVSWQNKYFRLIFRILDYPDYAVRYFNKISYLPKYSIRIYSNGITKQFGGFRFRNLGNQIADMIVKNTNLQSTGKVLEIGCGCGRNAYALSKILNDGNYTGMDIHLPSMQSCIDSKYLTDKNFKFDLLDVYNKEYNPGGKSKAAEFVFPYNNNSYDVIFLISVFTHMLDMDVKNYMNEIERLLKPGGYCVISIFLMDYGWQGVTFDIPTQSGDSFLHQKDFPEKIVGYKSSFFDENFKRKNLKFETILIGDWRLKKPVTNYSDSPISQDIIIYRKQNESTSTN